MMACIENLFTFKYANDLIKIIRKLVLSKIKVSSCLIGPYTLPFSPSYYAEK